MENLVGGRALRKPVIAHLPLVLRARAAARHRGAAHSVDVPAAAIGHTKILPSTTRPTSRRVVKGVMRRLGIDDKQLKPRIVLSHISQAKNHMLDPQEVYLQSADPKTERVAHIYEIYRKELLKANALDFDDLLLETVRLLKSSSEVRENYNRRFQYLLIDEYQDTNRPQYELMRLLAGKHHNVCAVGDEDQSIYSWRGADIRNILEFEKDFPEAKIIRLEQNYRSTQSILEGASAVVANNSSARARTCGPRARAAPRSATTRRPTARTKRCSSPTTIAKYLREARQTWRRAARRGALPHELPVATV